MGMAGQTAKMMCRNLLSLRSMPDAETMGQSLAKSSRVRTSSSPEHRLKRRRAISPRTRFTTAKSSSRGEESCWDTVRSLSYSPQKVEPKLPYDRKPGPGQTVNGCTDVPNVFPRSCNAHDVCCQTPGATRAQCDYEFLLDMRKERPDLDYRDPRGNPSVIDIYYTGVRLFGWLFIPVSQSFLVNDSEII